VDYSPTLALATAAFEIAVAFWTLMYIAKLRSLLRRQDRRPHEGTQSDSRQAIGRTTVAILLLLAGYQITEVAICADPAASGILPRAAFSIVTGLPPLGILLVAQLHRPRSRAYYAGAYAALVVCAGVIGWIALDPSFASASVCNAVFALYNHTTSHFALYSWYYWIGLFAMVAFSGLSLRRRIEQPHRSLMRAVFLGTLGFVVPSVLTTRFAPAAEGALPSIMCHFALILALALAWMVYRMRRPVTGSVPTPCENERMPDSAFANR